jgi:hypothetical protein
MVGEDCLVAIHCHYFVREQIPILEKEMEFPTKVLRGAL